MPDVDSHPAATVSPSTSVARHSQIVEQIFAAQAENTPIPPSDHGQAMASPEAPLWRQGQIAEVREHIACNTIGPAVIPPPGARIIPASWVFSYKHDLQKSKLVHKSRTVLKGYRMLAGVDFNQTFAPVARVTSVRIILCLATKFKHQLTQLDIKTAFLYSPMDTEIYITLPPGFVTLWIVLGTLAKLPSRS